MQKQSHGFVHVCGFVVIEVSLLSLMRCVRSDLFAPQYLFLVLAFVRGGVLAITKITAFGLGGQGRRIA